VRLGIQPVRNRIGAGRSASVALEREQLVTLSTIAVIAALAALNVVKNLMPPGADGLVLSVAAAGALLVFARLSGLSWAQLGLGRHRFRSGRRWALIAVAVVAAVYLAGVLMPSTRPAFLDSRYQFGLPEAMRSAFIVIPLGTVLLEEVAFRSVLWGMLSRHMPTWRVVVVSSSLFGLWHVLPSLHFAAAHQAASGEAGHPDAGTTALVVLGTVLFTALGGVVAGELRRRSGSVLASAGMHWATNSLGVLFGVVAWRLVS
jgi:membrane protease YdiL (CAAX protease family)